MKEKRNLFWQMAFTYVGAIVGAGFASGQELLRFFAKFGLLGVMGAILAGLLFAYFGFAIVTTAVSLNMDSYDQYLVFLFGRKKAKIFDGIICFFLWCGLAVMLVAGGSLCQQIWGWELKIGFVLNALLLYLVLLVGVKGMLWLNTLLIPGLIVLSIIVAGGGIMSGGGILSVQMPASGIPIDNWLLAAILYVSYNLVLGMVVLTTLGKTAKSGGKSGVILGGLALGILAATLTLAISMNTGIIKGQDLPLLTLAGALSPWLSESYSFVLWAAIFTTALGNGLGLLKRLEGLRPWPRPLLAALLFLPTLILFGWSLGRAVGVFYPVLGYVGLILFIAILLRKKLS